MPLNDDLIKRTRKSVKNYKDKVRILKNKGVSAGALPRVGSAKELLKAYENDPAGLRRRLKEFDEFTTKGKVYKTEGGISLTSTVKKYKNREIRRSLQNEQNKFAKAERAGLSSADYHERRIKRLANTIEKADYADLRSINYAITNPEFVKLEKKTAVENFMKGINFGLGGMDNDTFQDPELANRLRNNLSKLTEDELADLMESNNTVKTLMNYYRERDKIEKGEPIQFSGGSYDELLEDLDKDMPSIIRHYKRLRKK